MFSYTVAFNPLTQSFDNQYPIFLQDKDVSSVEFSQTVATASFLLHQKSQEAKQKKKRAFLLVLVGILLLLLSFFVPLFLDFRGFSLIFVAFGFIGFVVCLGISIRKGHFHFRQTMAEAKQNLDVFLQYENSGKYFARGVQFLYREEYHFNEHNGHHGITRKFLEINASTDPFVPAQPLVHPVAPAAAVPLHPLIHQQQQHQSVSHQQSVSPLPHQQSVPLPLQQQQYQQSVPLQQQQSSQPLQHRLPATTMVGIRMDPLQMPPVTPLHQHAQHSSETNVAYPVQPLPPVTPMVYTRSLVPTGVLPRSTSANQGLLTNQQLQ